MNNEQQHTDKREWLSITSLCLGIASIFLWEFSLIPILAIIFGGIGLIRDTKKWKAGIGLALGIVFLVVRISQGHMDGIFSNIYSSNNNTQQTSSAPTPQPPAPTPLQSTTSPTVSEPQKALTKEEIFLLRVNMILITNGARAPRSSLLQPAPPQLPRLSVDKILEDRAQWRANWLCAAGQWSHEGWEDSFQGLSYQYHGENLAEGSTDASELGASLMASPEHKANIMNPNFTNMGVGYAQDCNLVVELFGG
ncbi:MAG: CAP domain-containing protein [bacterium]|nr:CAP domain-containing protein [bacterium]